MRGSDRKLLLLEEILDNVHAQEVGKVSVDIFDDDIYDENNDAMLIYTSGTTGSPKGVVLSHRNIIHQINGMLDAWGWSEKDCILHVLPLHHTHGMINCLLCPLAVGAKILMLPKFDAGKVWEILLNRNETNVHSEVDVFMAVPTIYAKLIQKFQEPEFQAKYNAEDVKATIMEKIRLMVCGSAALPTVRSNKNVISFIPVADYDCGFPLIPAYLERVEEDLRTYSSRALWCDRAWHGLV